MEINELLNEVLSAEKRAEEIAEKARSDAREIVMKAEADAKNYLSSAKESIKAGNVSAREAADAKAAELTEKIIDEAVSDAVPDIGEAVVALTEKYKAKYGCR